MHLTLDESIGIMKEVIINTKCILQKFVLLFILTSFLTKKHLDLQLLE